MRIFYVVYVFIVSCALAESNVRCDVEFEMDVAIMIDANGTQSIFEKQKKFAREIIRRLPDVGKSVRVTVVPIWPKIPNLNNYTSITIWLKFDLNYNYLCHGQFSWRRTTPVNRLTANVSRQRALDFLSQV